MAVVVQISQVTRSITYPTPVIFNAGAFDSSTGNPVTGTMTISVDGGAPSAPQTFDGTFINSNFTVSVLPGTHTVTAQFTGTGAYAGVTAQQIMSQTIAGVTTSVTIGQATAGAPGIVNVPISLSGTFVGGDSYDFSGFGGTATRPVTFIGQAGGVALLVETALGQSGLDNAASCFSRLAADVADLQSSFGTTVTLPTGTFIISHFSPGNNGTGGAYHRLTGTTTGDPVCYCDAAFEDSRITSCLFMAEFSEVAQTNQNLGWVGSSSNGEALSRVHPEYHYPGVFESAGYYTANTWLNTLAGGLRADWVTTTDGTDQSGISTGCDALFIWWLYSLGFTSAQITQAGGSTLASTYQKLTGKTTAFADFNAAVNANWPTSGNPYSFHYDNLWAGVSPVPGPAPAIPALPSPNPTGQVTLSVDGGVPISATLSNGSASVSVPISSLSGGPHSITVNYPGNGVFSPSIATSTLALHKLDGSGSVVFTLLGLSVGTHTLLAAYTPDVGTIFVGSSGSGTVTITSTAVQTTTNVQSVSVPLGTDASITVTVSPNAGTTIPSGSVVLTVDGVNLPGSQNLNPSGQTTFSVPAASINSIGSHSVTATYTPTDTNQFVASSGNGTITVTGVPTTTSISSPSVSWFSSALITVTVTGSPTPQGSVGLVIDGTIAPPSQSLANGVTAFTIATGTLSVGTHALTATYSPSANTWQGSSATGSITITGVATHTVVTANSVAWPSGVPVTIKVTPDSQPITGFVNLDVDGGSAGGGSSFTNLTLNAAGVAQTSVTGLAAGSHSFVATYPAQGGFLASSGSAAASVTGAATAVNVVLPSVTFPNAATILVTVNGPSGPVPGGNINWSVDGGPTNQSTLSSSGRATFSLSGLAAGPHTIPVTFLGFQNYAGSSATPTPVLTVQPAATTTTLSANPSTFAYPGTVTVSTTVTSSPAALAAGGQPAGNVVLIIDGVTENTQPLFSGSATFPPVGGLSAGTHALEVDYRGQGNFATSKATGTLTVTGTPTQLSVSAPSVAAGSTATITVTVSTNVGLTPSGQVGLTITGGPAVAPQTLDTSGQTQFSIAGLAAGSYVVTGTYAAQNNFAAATASTTLVITGAGTFVTLTAPTTIPFGQTVQAAVVVTSNQGTPPGTVTLSSDQTSAQILPSPSQNLSGGRATFTVSGLTIGTHTLTAVYAGTSQFSGGSASATVTVTAISTVLNVRSPNISWGQVEDVTVSVSSPSGQPTPTGNVVLTLDGGSPVAKALTAGSVDFFFTGLSLGTHSLHVTYGAQNGFDAAAPVDQSFQVTGTQTQVSIQAANITWPQTASITVTVSSSGGTPGGQVSLTLQGTTQTAPAVAPQTLSAGQAPFSVPGLHADTYTITAQYLGQAPFLPQSAQAQLQVSPAATSTAITVNSPAYPAPLQVTVTVTSPAAPVGQVTLSIPGGPSIQPQALSGGSTTFSVPLPAGNYTVQASFSGQDFGPSSASTQANVSGTTTTTKITATDVTYPAPVQATVTVTSGSGIPTGSVNFTVDGTALSPQTLANGTTSYTIGGLNRGPHALHADYIPDTNFGASSGDAQVNVLGIPTTISPLQPGSFTFGSAVQVTVRVTAAALPPATGSVTLTVDGSDKTAQLDGSGLAPFNLGTGLSVGQHFLRASYPGDGNYAAAASVTGTLTITGAQPTLTITAPDVTYPAAATITVTGSTSSGAQLAGTVTISVDGKPSIGQVLQNGSATFSVNGLLPGQHRVVATFQQQGGFLYATASATFNVTGTISTTTTVSAPNVSFPSSVPITVIVKPAAGAVQGDVSLSVDGGTSSTKPLSSGRTVFLISGLAIGTHTATATYLGQPGYATNSGTTTFRVTAGCNCAAFTTTAWQLSPSATRSCYWSKLIDSHHLVELYYDTAATNFKLIFSWPGLNQTLCPPAIYTAANFNCCGASSFTFLSGGTGCNSLPSTVTISTAGNCACGSPVQGNIPCQPCVALPQTIHITLLDITGHCPCNAGKVFTLNYDPVNRFYKGSLILCDFIDSVGGDHKCYVEIDWLCDGSVLQLIHKSQNANGGVCASTFGTIVGTCSPLNLTADFQFIDLNCQCCDFGQFSQVLQAVITI